MVQPHRVEDKGDIVTLVFPYVNGDGQMEDLPVKFFRRRLGHESEPADLVVVLDGDEFLRKTHLLRLLDLGESHFNYLPADVLSIPPGFGNHSRNEKYFGAGEYFAETITNVTGMIQHVVDRFYKGSVNRLTLLGNSLTGRAALDITARVAKEDEHIGRYQQFRICAVAPSFWQLFRTPLRTQLEFMIEKWFIHNHSPSVAAEVDRRYEMMVRANRMLVHDWRFLYQARIYLMISYTELLRFSGDFTQRSLEEMLGEMRDHDELKFPNLRKFFRMLVHFDKNKTQNWVDYLHHRLLEFRDDAGKVISPWHYDVFYPSPDICNIIYKDGHTWTRWAHLFKTVTDPTKPDLPDPFQR